MAQGRGSSRTAVAVFAALVATIALVLYWRVDAEEEVGDYETRKGNYRLEDGQYDQAIGEFQAALGRNPSHLGAC